MYKSQGALRVIGVNLLLATFVMGTLFLSIGQASAQTGSLGISIGPPNTELAAAPGESVTRKVQVTNQGSSSVSVDMSKNNSAPSGEEGGASFLPGTSGLASWMTMSPTSFSLGAGESLDVTIELDVPSNAPAGGHYATLFAAASSGDVTTSGSGVGTIVGANFLLNVTGNVREAANLVEFSTPRQRLNAGEDVEFMLRVSNSGNTHLRPSGVVELFRNDVKVDEIAVNESGAFVLPNSTRKFSVESDKALLPGAYSAKVSLSYGSGGQLLSSSPISFAVIGDSSVMTLVAGGLAALVVLLALALVVGRKKGTVK